MYDMGLVHSICSVGIKCSQLSKQSGYSLRAHAKWQYCLSSMVTGGQPNADAAYQPLLLWDNAGRCQLDRNTLDWYKLIALPTDHFSFAHLTSLGGLSSFLWFIVSEKDSGTHACYWIWCKFCINKNTMSFVIAYFLFLMLWHDCPLSHLQKNFKHVIMQYPGIAHEHHLLYSKRDTGGKFSDNGPVPISFDDEIVFEGTVTNYIIVLDP